jgi:hypothetical protein
MTMADTLPAVLQPVSLSGPTWEKLRQAAYAIPEGKRGAIIAAATLDEQQKPKADLLLVHKVGDRWYIAGSIGYSAGKPSFAVTTTLTW